MPQIPAFHPAACWNVLRVRKGVIVILKYTSPKRPSAEWRRRGNRTRVGASLKCGSAPCVSAERPQRDLIGFICYVLLLQGDVQLFAHFSDLSFCASLTMKLSTLKKCREYNTSYDTCLHSRFCSRQTICRLFSLMNNPFINHKVIHEIRVALTLSLAL